MAANEIKLHLSILEGFGPITEANQNSLFKIQTVDILNIEFEDDSGKACIMILDLKKGISTCSVSPTQKHRLISIALLVFQLRNGVGNDVEFHWEQEKKNLEEFETNERTTQ